MIQQASAQVPVALRQAGAIPFMLHALLDRIPLPTTHSSGLLDSGTQVPAVKLDEHFLPYEGCVTDPKLFVRGLYGTSDRTDARAASLVAAKRNRKQVLEIEGSYHLDDFHLVKLGLDREAALQTGFIHVHRLKTSFSAELKSFLLETASTRLPGFDALKHAKLSLGDLLLEFPALVPLLFDMDSRVLMVVHRARQTWDLDARRTVHVSTMRRIAGRIQNVRASNLPSVPIYC